MLIGSAVVLNLKADLGKMQHVVVCFAFPLRQENSHLKTDSFCLLICTLALWCWLLPVTLS